MPDEKTQSLTSEMFLSPVKLVSHEIIVAYFLMHRHV